MTLITHRDPVVRISAAEDLSAPIAALDFLSRDRIPEVLAAVLENRRSTLHMQARIRKRICMSGDQYESTRLRLLTTNRTFPKWVYEDLFAVGGWATKLLLAQSSSCPAYMDSWFEELEVEPITNALSGKVVISDRNAVIRGIVRKKRGAL